MDSIHILGFLIHFFVAIVRYHEIVKFFIRLGKRNTNDPNFKKTDWQLYWERTVQYGTVLFQKILHFEVRYEMKRYVHMSVMDGLKQEIDEIDVFK